LARLPAPQRVPMDIADWVKRAITLERRLLVENQSGPALSMLGDPAQLDQLLINLLKNAVEAAQECGGGVRVRWARADSQLELVLEDEGPGVSETANLFVPLFTTKPGGSGIGLALAREIAEAHAGELTLRTRADRRGARAVVRLPLS
jgi:signal transduction histidine kinase